MAAGKALLEACRPVEARAVCEQMRIDCDDATLRAHATILLGQATLWGVAPASVGDELWALATTAHVDAQDNATE